RLGVPVYHRRAVPGARGAVEIRGRPAQAHRRHGRSARRHRPCQGIALAEVLDAAGGPGVHRDHPALFVMSGESFNLDTQEDAAHEGGAHAPHQRGSLKPSILAPTWLARFETPSAHGRRGVPSSLTLSPRRAYTFSGFRPFAVSESSDRSGVTPRF